MRPTKLTTPALHASAHLASDLAHVCAASCISQKSRSVLWLEWLNQKPLQIEIIDELPRFGRCRETLADNAEPVPRVDDAKVKHFQPSMAYSK